MRLNNLLKFSTLLIAPLLLCAVANADDQRGMMKPGNENAPANIISKAATTYRNFQKSASSIPTSVTSKAQCVVVIPEAVTAAVVVGGTHGNGIASCKVNGKWSGQAFVDLNGASLGVQLGGKSSDVVLFLTNAAAAESLKKGKLEFGADASVVAGNFDRAFEYGSAGVVAYENASGAYLGASLTGGILSQAADSNSAYYGKECTTSTILNGKEDAKSALESANTFISQLPA